MNINEEMENIRHLNGQIEALQVKTRELSDARTAAKDRIHAHMQKTLETAYGSEYLPRITLYTDDRQMKRSAKQYKAEVTLILVPGEVQE